MPDSFIEDDRGSRGPVWHTTPIPRLKIKDLLDGTYAQVVVRPPNSSTRINTATTTVIKNTPGEFWGILVGQTVGSGVIEVFNSLTASGQVVLRIANPATVKADQISMALATGVNMSIGITVRTTGVQDMMIIWR